MSYRELRQAADSTPLAHALTEIARIVDSSESDSEKMSAMLDEIDDLVSKGRSEWLKSIRKAQDEELARLRKEVRG